MYVKIKQKEDPQISWVRTTNFMFITTKEGVYSFGKFKTPRKLKQLDMCFFQIDAFKNAARAKSDEILRKDTTDESDIADFS